MKKLSIIAANISLVLFLTACSEEEFVPKTYETSPQGQEWVAKVGEANITNAELSQLLAFYHARPGKVSQKDIDDALQQLIEEELRYQEAVARGYDRHPDFLIRKRRLLSNTLMMESKRERYRTVNVTEFDVKAYYESNLHLYSTPNMVRTAVVRLPKEKEEYANTIKIKAQELEVNLGFGKWSNATDLQRTKNRGGLQSWNADTVPPIELPNDVWKRVGDYQIGKVLGPFENEGQIYLVRIVAYKMGTVRSLEEVYRDIKQSLVQEEMKKIDDKFEASLNKKYKVEINNKALPDIQPATSNSTPPGFPR